MNYPPTAAVSNFSSISGQMPATGETELSVDLVAYARSLNVFF
jgi:hypothetical protein